MNSTVKYKESGDEEDWFGTTMEEEKEDDDNCDNDSNKTVIQIMEEIESGYEYEDDTLDTPVILAVYRTKQEGKYMIVYDINYKEEMEIWMKDNFHNLYKSTDNYDETTKQFPEFATPSIQKKQKQNSLYAEKLRRDHVDTGMETDDSGTEAENTAEPKPYIRKNRKQIIILIDNDIFPALGKENQKDQKNPWFSGKH